MTFAMVVLALVVNLTLLVRIRFGEMMVTHLSLHPYIVSFCLLLAMLVEISVLLFLSELTYRDDLDALVDQMIFPGNSLNSVFSGLTDLKFMLLLVFILTRAHEQEALMVFIYFQRSFRLENLIVARDSYVKLEKRLNNGFRIMLVAGIAFSPLLFAGRFFAPVGLSTKMSSVY
mgnify:CR=1 FL=1